MIRGFFNIGIVIGILSLLSALIPDIVIAAMDNALVNILGYLYNLDLFLNADVLLLNLQILFNFLSGVMIFYVVLWLSGMLTRE